MEFDFDPEACLAGLPRLPVGEGDHYDQEDDLDAESHEVDLS